MISMFNFLNYFVFVCENNKVVEYLLGVSYSIYIFNYITFFSTIKNNAEFILIFKKKFPEKIRFLCKNYCYKSDFEAARTDSKFVILKMIKIFVFCLKSYRKTKKNEKKIHLLNAKFGKIFDF